MNKKMLTIFAVLLLFLTVSTASAGFFDFFESSNSNVKNDDKTFIVGFNTEFPPFGYKTDNGSYAGFDLELAKEVCNRNNWTFVPQPIINWESKEMEVNSGEIDCIWSEFTINNRENNYTWSDPYFNNSQVIVVSSDSNISSISDLKGKTVEVQGESSALYALEHDNKTISDTFNKIQRVNDYNTAFMDLKSGACDAVVVDLPCANYHLTNKFNSTDFKILNETLTLEQYGIGFKKGNTELRNQVQKTLDEMYKDGTVDKIAQNYSDYGIPEHIIRK
jgi:polar amino acid transport system substrate-binding protein